MNVHRTLHILTADQRHLVETIASGEHTRLLVIAPPGMGKTYGVSAAVSELLVRMPLARVLMLAPAAICAQQVAMLADRLQDATPVVRVTGKTDLSFHGQAGDGGFQPGVYVVSIDLAKREDIAATLAATAWDLAVVDEAHGATGTRADLLMRLVEDERVRSLVLLSALALKENRLTDGLKVVRWSRKDNRSSPRFQMVISYERTTGEQELYLRLREFLDAHTNDSMMRNVVERSWRSSIIALEQVLLRARSKLEVSRSGLGRTAQWPSLNTLPRSNQTLSGHLAGEPTVWLDSAAAAAGMDELLRHISSLQIDSKLEATLMAIEHRRTDGATLPCVVTAMRESAIYVAQALESRQQVSMLVDGQTRAEVKNKIGTGNVVVVATDPGLQGLELATDTMLNYELPQSRLRIEQRWGRIDRVGREEPVTMLALRDLSAVDAEEEELLRLHGFISPLV